MVSTYAHLTFEICNAVWWLAKLLLEYESWSPFLEIPYWSRNRFSYLTWYHAGKVPFPIKSAKYSYLAKLVVSFPAQLLSPERKCVAHSYIARSSGCARCRSLWYFVGIILGSSTELNEVPLDPPVLYQGCHLQYLPTLSLVFSF